MQKLAFDDNKPYFIKYYPELNKTFSNRNASIIIDRMEYWFNKAQNGFYKFLEPCSLKMYRVGDSWLEETGIKRQAFKRAFLLIGTWYNSKSEFIAQDDPFKGKLYSAYYDRKQNKMFFLKNHEAVTSFFQKISAKKSAKVEDKSTDNNRSLSTQNNRSWSGHNNRSFPRVYNIHARNKQITTPNLSNNNLSEYDQKLQNIEIDKNDNKIIINKLKNIWKEEVGEFKDYNKTKYIAKQLIYAYENCFRGKEEEFRLFFRKVCSSKFLMGEVNHFKARTDWLLQPAIILAIEEGCYSTGDRKTLHELNQQAIKHQQKEIHISYLNKQAEQVGKNGIVANLKLFIINRFSYDVYISWFSKVIFITTDNNFAIEGNSSFINDYIESHYFSSIQRYYESIC